MLKVSKRFGLDELKMVLEKYYDNSKISYIEETLIMTDVWSDGDIAILCISCEHEYCDDAYCVVAPETYEAFF